MKSALIVGVFVVTACVAMLTYSANPTQKVAKPAPAQAAPQYEYFNDSVRRSVVTNQWEVKRENDWEKIEQADLLGMNLRPSKKKEK